MVTITTNLGVQVKSGPQVSIPLVSMEVEAYDKIEISLDPEGASSTATIEVQPGDKGVSFLLITSSLYTPVGAPANKQLSYTPEGKPNINLESPQLYLGADSIAKLLGAVKKITLTNQLESSAENPSKADISILVGRDATP